MFPHTLFSFPSPHPHQANSLMQPLDDLLCEDQVVATATMDTVTMDTYQEQIDHYQPMAVRLKEVYTNAALTGEALSHAHTLPHTLTLLTFDLQAASFLN